MKRLVLAALLASATAPAMASQTFNFTFADRGATAIGSFELDHTGNILEAGSHGADISNMHLTISGASVGNGVFGPSDFYNFYFDNSLDLDLTQELVGQGQASGSTFGDDSTLSDFNLFGGTSGSPLGTWFFTLSTAQGIGDPLVLTSLRMTGESPAPEPASWALMLGGFGMIGGALRSRRKASVTFA